MDGPTLLARYLARSKTPIPAFAEAVSADRARIHRCLNGERRPGLELALEIERETRGAVPAAAWRVRRPARRSGKHLSKSNV